MKTGVLYGVGIGPGDPQYVTLRAAELIKQVDVIFTVISKNACDSVSKGVVEYFQPRGDVRLLTFTMSRDHAERFAVVQANTEAIIAELKQGKDCVFATLGDAMTYSTFGYVVQIIKEAIPDIQIEIVPGITSFATLAAKSGEVLVENKEQLRVIPSFKSDMADSLTFPEGSTTILLKTYRSRKALIQRLRREEHITVTYGEQLSRQGQIVLHNIDDIAALPESYLSLIMVKKGFTA
ncbi:MAG: precorrin-2 C(20)-methyltransferase [Pseudomonadota bacterium]